MIMRPMIASMLMGLAVPAALAQQPTYVAVEWSRSPTRPPPPATPSTAPIVRAQFTQPEPIMPAPRVEVESSIVTPRLLPDERSGLPITLPAAMQLANARPLDIQIAARQVQAAVAQFDRAKVLWVPSLIGGVDYFRHGGNVQNFEGEVLDRDRQSFMIGGGANAVFGINDAIFAPLAARQDANARRALLQAVNNDAALAVAEAYFGVQQARGELAGALNYVQQAEELVRRTKELAEGLAPPMEATRARVELARRQQAVATLRERWQIESAELVRILRLDAASVVEPLEPANLTVNLVEPSLSLDELIAFGLTSRPELAAHQAFVKATLQRLRQEKLRPLVPSLLLRSVSTNPSGSLGWGSFGGGRDSISTLKPRYDYDVQVLWELQNFGLGNKARVDERNAEREAALLELFRIQDRVAAEVVRAQAQVTAARTRLKAAEPAMTDALDSLQKNMEGLSQTRRLGNVLILVVRPQEAVAALQALAQANSDYYSAVADYNRAQFRLYRAIGHPAGALPCAVEQQP